MRSSVSPPRSKTQHQSRRRNGLVRPKPTIQSCAELGLTRKHRSVLLISSVTINCQPQRIAKRFKTVQVVQTVQSGTDVRSFRVETAVGTEKVPRGLVNSVPVSQIRCQPRDATWSSHNQSSKTYFTAETRSSQRSEYI